MEENILACKIYSVEDEANGGPKEGGSAHLRFWERMRRRNKRGRVRLTKYIESQKDKKRGCFCVFQNEEGMSFL